MAVRQLKFKECRECEHQRTATCRLCTAGEFFEVKSPKEMSDQDLLDGLKEMSDEE